MFGRFVKIATLIGVLVAVGCEVTDSLSSEPDFGDAYRVAAETTPTTTAPRLDADGLHVTLHYSGGCMQHRFEVRFRRSGNTTEIWLRHDGNGDLCEAYVTQTLRLEVSPRALETEQVVLLAPDGTAFTLR